MVQTTRQEVSRNDLNNDGFFDETTTTISVLTNGRVDTVTTSSVNTLYPHSTVAKISYVYDDMDLADGPVQEVREYDWDANGVFDEVSTLDRLFDGEGHTVQEIVSSGDMDGDGVAGDYRNITTFTENFAGSLTEKYTTYEAWGVTHPGDYLRETWTYRPDGQSVLSHAIDDPFRFDCVITRTNTYNSNGQIINVKEQNEIRYGDERARIDESYTYNSDGTMKTKTDWADHSDKGWFQRVDTAFTWKTGYDSQKISYDLTGDWDPEAVKFVEHWYNADGKLTHTLTSHDNDGNGGILAGGYDSRDLTVATWVGDTKVAEYTDIGLDGILDATFTSDMLVA